MTALPLRAAWRTLAALLLATAFVATPGLAVAKGGSKPPYEYYATGNPQATVNLPSSYATTSLVLMGGGPDVDEAFRWMITRAGIQPGTGGRFVVIRATGTDAYDPYLYYSDASLSTSSTIADQWVGGASLGLTSAETLVIPSIAAANDPTVNAIVARASAVFIAGGDQSDYINYWKGTALDQTLRGLLARNVPIGGTSAGLAVLGQFDYAALTGSVTSAQALANPYHRYITLDPNPLALTGGFLAPPALNSMILDSHLDARDRMGRLVTFVARLVARNGSVGCAGGVLPAAGSGAATARGIGIGVETALLVQGNQSTGGVSARRVTNVSTTTESAVYFVRPAVAPSTCASGKPLAMYGVEIRKLADSSTVFDLGNWSGLPVYKTVDAVAGQLSPANPY